MNYDVIKDAIIEALADYYGIDLEEDENGNYDISGYDWDSGCSFGGCDVPWLTLKNVVRCMMNNIDWDDVFYEAAEDVEE